VLTDKLGGANIRKVQRWLGVDDWAPFKRMDTHQRAKFFRDRFINELNYSFANAYPIYERGAEGRIMFWLIHGSDHPRAIELMNQAYGHVGLSLPDCQETMEQLTISDSILDS